MSKTSVKEKKEKVKGTPWTNLGIKLDLCSFLTRKVLTEKFFLKKEMEYFFISKINGCELFSNEDYMGFCFYIKTTMFKSGERKEILMMKCLKNKTFYIKYTNFWQVFESKYELNEIEIQFFIQAMIFKNLKLKNYNNNIKCLSHKLTIEEFIKHNDYTVCVDGFNTTTELEELLKYQGYRNFC